MRLHKFVKAFFTWLDKADLYISSLLVFIFLTFYTVICLEYVIFPILIPFLLLTLLSWLRVYEGHQIFALLSATLLIGFALLANWLNVTLPLLIALIMTQFDHSAHSTLYHTLCVGGETLPGKQFFNTVFVIESKERSFEDLKVIPTHEEVIKLGGGERILAICSEQKEPSLQPHNNIYGLDVDINQFLPHSQRYLNKHHLDLLIVKSAVLEQHYSDSLSPFVSAFTHSDGRWLELSNILVSDESDLYGNLRPQYRTGWVHFKPSHLRYVSHTGYLNAQGPWICDKVTHMEFISHKQVPFTHGLFVSGSKDYIDRTLLNLPKQHTLKEFFVTNNGSSKAVNTALNITLLKKRL